MQENLKTLDKVHANTEKDMKAVDLETSTGRHPRDRPDLALGKARSFFDQALANGHLEADGEVPYLNGIGGVAASAALDGWAKDEEVHDEIDPEEGGCGTSMQLLLMHMKINKKRQKSLKKSPTLEQALVQE